jgi:hypothetical protein
MISRYQLPYLSGGIYRFHDTVLLGGYFEGDTIQVSAMFRGRAEVFSEIFEQSNFRQKLLEGRIENCELGILEYINSDHVPRFVTVQRAIQIVDKKFIDWLEDKFSPRRSGGYGFKYWASMKFEEFEGEVCKVSLLHIDLWNGIWYES